MIDLDYLRRRVEESRKSQSYPIGSQIDVTDDLEEAVEEIERLKHRILDDNKAYGCELRDPYGTIWEYAEKLRQENERLKAQQAETDCENWWPTVERFLHIAVADQTEGESVPERIERGIDNVKYLRESFYRWWKELPTTKSLPESNRNWIEASEAAKEE
jgi:hypothetical protein